MLALTQQLEESCLLAVLNGEQRLIIHQELCDQPLQVQTAEEKQAYDSASGRLLIGLLPDAKLVRFKNRYGLPTPEVWEEAASEPKFYAQIQTIQDRGYAYQETQRQVIDYAVAVYQKEKCDHRAYKPTSRLSSLQTAHRPFVH